MLGPRYSDPANRQSGFSVAVGSALSGFTGAQDFARKRKLDTQADEDRQREIDREAKQDAERDYELGITTDPTAAVPAAPPGAPAAQQAAPTTPGSLAAPSIGGGDVAPQPDLTFGAAVGQALGGATQAGRPAPPVSAMPNAPAPVMSGEQPQGGGIRSRVAEVLGRIGSNVTTGGYTPKPTPTYSVTRTGPSAKEREEGVRQTGETSRETSREKNAAGIAAGNNRTSIEVANINAGARRDAAAAKAAADNRSKLTMQAINNQLQNTDRAVAQLEKEYDKAEPSLIDNTATKAEKKARQGRIQLQIDRLRQQRGNLAQQQQTMMLGMAMGVSDFDGLLPAPTSMADPNDDSQLSDADLWEKKRSEGMTQEQATTFVRQRKRGP